MMNSTTQPVTQTAVERHNAFAGIKPDALACYLCGRREYSVPIADEFPVRDCDRCERPVCELCAEIDCGGEGEGVSWLCDSLKGGCRRDFAAEFDAACDDICNWLADELEGIDRKHGIEPHDYSVLRSCKEAA